jgi:FlaG/FlaF family flagellin (archaellin)
MRRRFRGDRSGVSEVIANILILAMTVILFSSVFYWVGYMPAPQSSKRVEIGATLEKAGTRYWLNLTHNGGEDLISWNTIILAELSNSNNLTYRLQLDNSSLSLGDSWSIGETFAWTFTRGTQVGSVLTSLYAKDRGIVVWQENVELKVSMGPYIAEAGANPSSPQVNGNFVVYAEIYDAKNAINPAQVWVDLSSLGLGRRVPLYFSMATARYETPSLIAPWFPQKSITCWSPVAASRRRTRRWPPSA